MTKEEFEQEFIVLLRQRSSTSSLSELKEATSVASWYVRARMGDYGDAMATFSKTTIAEFCMMCFVMGHAYASYNDINNVVAVFHRKCVAQIRDLRPELTELQLHATADAICNSMMARGTSFVDNDPVITFETAEVASALQERRDSETRMQ